MSKCWTNSSSTPSRAISRSGPERVSQSAAAGMKTLRGCGSKRSTPAGWPRHGRSQASDQRGVAEMQPSKLPIANTSRADA
jgi:hypothetical protein